MDYLHGDTRNPDMTASTFSLTHMHDINDIGTTASTVNLTAQALLEDNFTALIESNTKVFDYYDYLEDNIEIVQEHCQAYQKYYNYKAIIDIYIVGVLILFGLVGNTISVIVLNSDNVNRTVAFLLQSLAVADNFYLVSCLFLQTIRALGDCTTWAPNLREVYPHWEAYIWAFAAISQTTAVWLVVLVTLDRYFAICHPFDVNRLCTLPRAKIIVACITGIAVIYNIPRFFEHEIVQRFDYCLRTYKTVAEHSEMRKSKIYFIVYKTSMYIIFRIIVPLITLFVLNIRLVIILKGAMRRHASMTRSNQTSRNDSFTPILITVVTVFLICEVPDAMVRIAITVSHFNENFTLNSLRLTYITTFTNLLLTVNSSVNCLIYCITGKRFRLLLKRLLFRSCSAEKNRWNRHTQLTFKDSIHSRRKQDTQMSTSLTNNCITACGDTTTATLLKASIKPPKFEGYIKKTRAKSECL